MRNTYKKGCFGIVGISAFALGALFLPSFLFGDMVEGASRVPGVTLGAVLTAIGVIFITMTIVANYKEKTRISSLVGTANKP